MLLSVAGVSSYFYHLATVFFLSFSIFSVQVSVGAEGITLPSAPNSSGAVGPQYSHRGAPHIHVVTIPKNDRMEDDRMELLFPTEAATLRFLLTA